MEILSYRPCGACNELVAIDEGCPHWKPQLRAVRAAYLTLARKRKAEAERARENAQKAVAEFFRIMTPR